MSTVSAVCLSVVNIAKYLLQPAFGNFASMFGDRIAVWYDTDLQQPTNAKILQSLEQASAQQDMNRSLLRITYILQQGWLACFS